MVGLASAVCREAERGNLTEVSVEVPLDVVDGNVVEGFSEGRLKIFNNRGICHVKHHLMTAESASSARCLQYPLGMGAEQIGVGVDHLRLDPDTEVDANLLDALNECGETVLESFGICLPISETCVVAVALAEPTVVHNKHINTAFLCGIGKVHHLVLVKVEEHALPRVENNGTFPYRAGTNDIAADEAVHIS